MTFLLDNTCSDGSVYVPGIDNNYLMSKFHTPSVFSNDGYEPAASAHADGGHLMRARPMMVFPTDALAGSFYPGGLCAPLQYDLTRIA